VLKPGVVVRDYNPSHSGGRSRKISIRGKSKTNLKNKQKQKISGGVDQVVEPLEVLSSNPSTTNKGRWGFIIAPLSGGCWEECV
jgi:hypothetical protein